nr:nucleoside hydrolase [Nocardia transvalensis]
MFDRRGRARPPLVVFSTDAGYDVDDFVSLVIAARLCERLAVVSSDETHRRRARILRSLLALLGRPDVEVFEGVDLGGHRRFLLDHELPTSPGAAFRQLGDLAKMIAAEHEPVIWVGQGAMSELAYLLTAAPHLAHAIRVTQMGGWLDNYRDPTRASHNLHIDQPAAGVALRLAHRPRLVLSDHTNTDRLAAWPHSPMPHWLATSSEPWARLVGENFTTWWFWQQKRGKPARTRFHDPVTLLAALGEPYVSFTPERIRILPDARTVRDPDGIHAEVSTGIDHQAAMTRIHHIVCAA